MLYAIMPYYVYLDELFTRRDVMAFHIHTNRFAEAAGISTRHPPHKQSNCVCVFVCIQEHPRMHTSNCEPYSELSLNFSTKMDAQQRIRERERETKDR